jgi:hypothetical protein
MNFLIAIFAFVLSSHALAADVLAPSGRSTINIPGFRTYVASGYVPSAQNIIFLKAKKDKASGLRLVAFDTSKNNAAMLMCRMSFPVYGPKKTPFASLLEAAMNLELGESGLVSADAPRVQAILEEFDFSSFGGGKWTMRVTFTLPGKEPLTINHVHSYSVSPSAGAGCKDVTNAMVPAIESLLDAFYSDARFLELMQQVP